MQILWTVVVLLALIALGGLFISRLNAQQAGRVTHHLHADTHPPFLHRTARRPEDGPLAGPPEPPPPSRGDPPWRSDNR